MKEWYVPLPLSTMLLDTAYQEADLCMSHMGISAPNGTLTPGNAITFMHC